MAIDSEVLYHFVELWKVLNPARLQSLIECILTSCDSEIDDRSCELPEQFLEKLAVAGVLTPTENGLGKLKSEFTCYLIARNHVSIQGLGEQLNY